MLRRGEALAFREQPIQGRLKGEDFDRIGWLAATTQRIPAADEPPAILLPDVRSLIPSSEPINPERRDDPGLRRVIVLESPVCHTVQPRNGGVAAMLVDRPPQVFAELLGFGGQLDRSGQRRLARVGNAEAGPHLAAGALCLDPPVLQGRNLYQKTIPTARAGYPLFRERIAHRAPSISRGVTSVLRR
jgi:hypothetical protein